MSAKLPRQSRLRPARGEFGWNERPYSSYPCKQDITHTSCKESKNYLY